MKKKIFTLIAVMVMIAFAAAFSSCNKVTLAGDINENGKEATYTANKADKDDYLIHGTLIVGDNEQIVIDSELEKGSMQFEFIASEGADDIETLPDTEGLQATYTAYVTGTESQTVSFGAGEYMIKASATEDGTKGEVKIEVKGFDD